MAQRVRWGVIGSGGIAFRRTMPEGILAAANAELVSVYDLDSGRNLEAARRFGARAAGSIDELLGAGVECVYVATPADCHFEHAAACAAAGKHVLCEKPLGLSVDEGMRMLALFERAGLRLGTAFMMRFHSQHLAALRLIESGRLGEPVYARAQLSCWYPPIEGAWRQDPNRGGGGSLMDMGGHCLDLLEMFFGPIRSVQCAVSNRVHFYRPEDSAVVCVTFENGALGTVDTFFCIPDTASENALELYGSRGSILATGTIGQCGAGTMRAFLAPDQNASYSAQQDRHAAGQRIVPEPVNTYRAEIEEFGRAVIEGRPPSISAEAGLRSQCVLAACYESARTGRSVNVMSRGGAGQPEFRGAGVMESSQ
jgi:predicted dehydrogenase